MFSRHLCEELIVEIFTRLPTKSLMRFRTVSKSLRACIGSPGFIRVHALRSPEKVMLVQIVYNEEERRINYIYTLHARGQLSYEPYVEYPLVNFRVVGSCNGIVCFYQYRNGINLWNPSIRRRVTVVDRPSLSDPEGCWEPLGFGFDPVVDDYKILIIEKRVTRRTLVYTMKTDAWREIASPTTPIGCTKSCQCLFNGVLHWAVKWYSFDLRKYYDYYILAFDLSSEVFSTIEVPEPSWETSQPAVINGSLAVISSTRDDCWIWVRNSTNTWSVAFKLNASEFGDFLFNPYVSGAIVYRPKTTRLPCLCRCCGLFIMIPCVESLQLLDTGTSCDNGARNLRKGIHPFLLL